jgi:hypothetical protein
LSKPSAAEDTNFNDDQDNGPILEADEDDDFEENFEQVIDQVKKVLQWQTIYLPPQRPSDLAKMGFKLDSEEEDILPDKVAEDETSISIQGVHLIIEKVSPSDPSIQLPLLMIQIDQCAILKHYYQTCDWHELRAPFYHDQDQSVPKRPLTNQELFEKQSQLIEYDIVSNNQSKLKIIVNYYNARLEIWEPAVEKMCVLLNSRS